MTCKLCGEPCRGNYCLSCGKGRERGQLAQDDAGIETEDRFKCTECGHTMPGYVGEQCPECGKDAVSPLEMEGSR